MIQFPPGASGTSIPVSSALITSSVLTVPGLGPGVGHSLYRDVAKASMFVDVDQLRKHVADIGSEFFAVIARHVLDKAGGNIHVSERGRREPLVLVTVGNRHVRPRRDF